MFEIDLQEEKKTHNAINTANRSCFTHECKIIPTISIPYIEPHNTNIFVSKKPLFNWISFSVVFVTQTVIAGVNRKNRLSGPLRCIMASKVR